MKFTVHIPDFVETREPRPVYEFNSLDELKEIPNVKAASERKGFSHFALSDQHLMEVSDEGRHWWVLGHIDDPSSLGLPAWDRGVYRVQMPDGQTVDLPGTQVAWSRGDEIGLRDGTTVQLISRT